MKEIIGSNVAGQIVVKYFDKTRNSGESCQAFLDRVNSSVDYDKEDTGALLTLDFGDLGGVAKEELLSKASYKDANDIIKDHNTIMMLHCLAEEKGNTKVLNDIIALRKDKVLEAILTLRKLTNVKFLHEIKLADLYYFMETKFAKSK